MRNLARETGKHLHSDIEKPVAEGAKRQGIIARVFGHAARLIGTGMMLCALSAPVVLASGTGALAETRSLKLYFVHTGEKAVITFKRNGVYDRQGLQQLNRFLRDWRRNQPTKMDPRLFDLIWEVYRKSGSNAYINVVCGFRSPETNALLRSRSKLVAEKSQHILGKAMDYFIPDVKLATLREIGMKMQIGGVGFYPHSGSPFVHMDVGRVRSWPRMNRSELVRLFPNGRTMHIPADGTPLPGYEEALADYKRRVGSDHIEIADTGGSKKKGFFATLFGIGADDDEDQAPAETAVASAEPAPRRQQEQILTNPSPDTQPILTAAGDAPSEAIHAPIPVGRPAFSDQVGNSGVAAALVEPPSDTASAALDAASQPQAAGADSYPDLAAYKIPVPTLLGKRQLPGEADIETAALSQDEQSAELAAVPVPVSRPAGSEALLAKAEGADAGDENGQSALSPDAAAALDQGSQIPGKAAVPAAAAPAAIATIPEVAAPPVDGGATADAKSADASDPYSTDEAEDSEDVAALEGQPDASSPNFGDAFDQPAAEQSPIAQGLPVKAGRPTAKDAAVAANGQKALTGDLLAKWAMNNARAGIIDQPVKAPRFVSLAMRAQPATPVTGGFTTKVATIDPARFSGGSTDQVLTNSN